MRNIVFALIVVCVPLTAFGQTRDENAARCGGSTTDPDLTIGACTALIQSGQEPTAVVASAFHNRGIGYRAKGQPDRAIQDYDESLRLRPDDADTLFSRGNAYNAKGDTARAIADYDRAIRSNPRLASAWFSRGTAHFRLGDTRKALQDLDQAIRIFPEIPDGWRDDIAAIYAPAFNNRCLVRLAVNQLEAALADCEEALRLQPDRANEPSNRGLVYLRMNRPDAALADFETALKSNPRGSYGLYGRGVIKRARGDSTGGNADIAAAVAAQADVAVEMARYGFSVPGAPDAGIASLPEPRLAQAPAPATPRAAVLIGALTGQTAAAATAPGADQSVVVTFSARPGLQVSFTSVRLRGNDAIIEGRATTLGGLSEILAAVERSGLFAGAVSVLDTMADATAPADAAAVRFSVQGRLAPGP